MKKIALIAASLALAGTASAADLRRPMPVKAPAPVPVAVYSWTGCYVGAGGGYAMTNTDSQTFTNAGAVISNEDTLGSRGWFGTVQVGCDYQVASNIVIGAFGDWDFGSIKGTYNVPGLDAQGSEKQKSAWAAGGRIGYIPWSSTQFMWFVSGGYTQAKVNEIQLFDEHPPFGALASSVAGHTYKGWFIGTGYEYGLSLLPGLFWKTEYRFSDFGKDTVQLTGALAGFNVQNERFSHAVRSELVWRFNFGGPVVARY